MVLMAARRFLWLLPLSLAPLLYNFFIRRNSKRREVIPPRQERVLILGASSGIGRAIAHLYAARDAYVCIVARRDDKLEAVKAECVELLPSHEEAKILKVNEDFSHPDGLLRVRAILEKEWSGLDTLVVNAGVSALQPLLTVAGVNRDDFGTRMTDINGLTRVRDVAAAAVRGNFTGPLLSAVTYIPFLAKTSKSPSILLVSSIAAVIPAPTRTLYAASKAASLLLFQSLSIEHPEIRFTYVLPSTIEGDFRNSAVDGGPIRETLSKTLKKDVVARECIRAIDVGQRTLWLPSVFRFFHLLYWTIPSMIDDGARKKYNFKS